MEDREHIWQLNATDTAKLREFLQHPNGSWLSADWNVQVDACGAGVLVRTQRYHSPLCVRCVYCGSVGETQGEAATHEPINDRGNFACKSAEACGLRQQGADAAYVLGRLLRDVRREAASVHPATLASLVVDAEDLAEKARECLNKTGQSADLAVYAERRDRAERQGRLF